ncbi:hypothetical protein A2W70_01760 [Candidatus Curtissbacteria bacterium RIFCSPLOWO2_02_41_11]|uniref:Cell division protein FtsL n=1 Tax=Candidatus Curtissbacteria bacterium RIFCSPLOWO2_02_41_11 TaxID=1797731 RepID=A0A1F5HQN5_9BACT|nr:MAG: hypothetical protein A2W70_01760 [Candidatus Curtissbacteria bacterium RIFCSPLOWO2_02_41_11]
MKPNLLLFLAVLVSIVLVVNSSKRILNLRTTSQQVKESEAQLENLRKDNEKLKEELKYKKSNEFAEKEIRDKLGLAREGEAVVILPKEEDQQVTIDRQQLTKPNWRKWRDLFLGS